MKFLLSLVSMISFLATSALAKPTVELSPDRTIILAGVISGALVRPMIKTLDKLAEDKEKPIDMVISSPGGSVVAGTIIIDRMEQLKLEGINFRCVVRDVAASMAFQILLHCNERYATPGAFLLWHPVRIFAEGVITADMAHVLAKQLKLADDVVLHDLRRFVPMKEKELMWHFKNETLHQAFNLLTSAPGFFKGVTNNIGNLRPAKPALDTAQFAGIFGSASIVYIHERFLSK